MHLLHIPESFQCTCRSQSATEQAAAARAAAVARCQTSCRPIVHNMLQLHSCVLLPCSCSARLACCADAASATMLPRGRSCLMAASAELGQRCTARAALHPARAAAAEMGRVLRWTSTRQQRTLRLRRLRCTSLATQEGTGLSQHTVMLLCGNDRNAAGMWHSAQSTLDGA